MKRLMLLAFGVLLFAACSTDAKFDENVEISMEIKQVGAGYCEVEFNPSKVTWFYAGVLEVEDGYNPALHKKNFMNLAIDEAYMEYIIWRHEMLESDVPFIADFASHSLCYGTTDRYELYLKPNTEYVLYCFVVNPETNKPVGELRTRKFHTLAESELNVNYEYRVKGQWDYVYPMDANRRIVENTPWVGYTRDESEITESGMTPREYFTDLYNKQIVTQLGPVFYGMYAHNNDGFGDGTSSTSFEKDHTYYTAVMTFDGSISDVSIFKFTWTGPDMDLYMVVN